MNFMERVFNSVSDLYKDMNLSQLSGANDVIVVKTANSYRSTGFHARFGNVHSFKTSREVILTVNDVVVNIDTRLDKEGNVFFSLHNSPIPEEETEPLNYNTATGFKTIKMLIESSANYSFLLANYERVYEGIYRGKYLFSECLHKRVLGDNIREIFNVNQVNSFLGSDTVVIGLFEENVDVPEFLLPFCLFSELYFCIERRVSTFDGAAKGKGECGCEGECECTNAKEGSNEAKKTTGRYLIKQLLRKRVCPRQNASTSSKNAILPEKYLKSMNLCSGANKAVYRLSGTPIVLTCNIYFWKDTEKIVISDIDGTVTKSDVIGYIYGAMGKDWTHSNIAALYGRIIENGYKIVYLSSRPIGHIGMTKEYLERVIQNNQYLPKGPVILFPGKLLSAIYREVVLGPEEFKIAAISEIKEIAASGDVFSGFGNKESDRMAYTMCDVDPSKIFIVNPLGEITTGAKGLVKLSHQSLYEMANGIFPPVKHALPSISQKYIGDTWWNNDAPEE
ncbi:phosphatidate phosphatase LPIN [Nematocida displodere]|uniref:Phosphatidate phosphatase LPIN n=1 Tax=Nematocida displodere TaxID=1805483 RepID=A0A177EF12_9MICR|nr:phosphatidate phosphatase LPIN [Nematocida displodere]